ncbi:MAG: tyrosine--tRNA ligase [Candidatus Thermoplasmatota archaeon]|jgi:tyrosyl-tRNA synthetase|nr:tyrosine--tRNA ligase [Candidatus Thermoplasmatota archaeon]
MLKDLSKLESVVQEVITSEELRTLDTAKGYCGFEPSGPIHLGTGLLWTNVMNAAADAGIEMTVLLADWHAAINDKFGGDLEKIRRNAEYMKEGFLSLGLNPQIKFRYASELVANSDYWALLLRVAKALTISRIKRALPILGRSEEDADKDSSKLIYPMMQATDIFYMDLDVAFGGMDQRHVHMLARDIHKKVDKKGFVAIHTSLISSLKGGNRMDPMNKMSKSKADSAVFIHDSPEDISRKIRSAFCPEKTVEGNPILQIYKNIIFNFYNNGIAIGEREEYGSYRDLERDFVEGKIHPADLKDSLSLKLIDILEPSKKYFERDSRRRELMEEFR